MEAHVPRHRDSKTKNHDIEIPRPKNHDIEKRRQISHDIEIPRLKNLESRFQGQKATTSSSFGILTLMLPDKGPTFIGALSKVESPVQNGGGWNI